MKTQINKIDNAIFDPTNGLEVQLGKTIHRVDDIFSDINGAVSGIKVRLTKVEKSSTESEEKIKVMEDSISRLAKLLDENKKISQQLTLMQGMIQKFSQQGVITASKITDLTKRGMEQNLIIYGVEEPPTDVRENCRKSVIEFLLEKMEIEVDPTEIWKAHRMGRRRVGVVRPVIVKLAYHVKDQIMENLGKLKGKVNSTTDKPLFISEQVPEAVTETKKQVAARLTGINKINDSLPKEKQQKIEVRNDKILLDGKVFDPEIKTPQPSELFLDSETQVKVNYINKEFVMTETAKVQNCEFIATAIKVNELEHIRLAYKAAMQRFPSADHVMMAYAFKDGEKFKHGHCDDNEYGGGMIVKKTMANAKAKDTAVFVMRRYGGIHLGSERFKAIEKITQEALKLLHNK